MKKIIEKYKIISEKSIKDIENIQKTMRNIKSFQEIQRKT